MIEKLNRNTIVYAEFATLSKNGNSKKAHMRQYVQHNCSYVIAANTVSNVYSLDIALFNGNMSCQRLLSSYFGFTNRSYSTFLHTKGSRNME